MGARKSILPTVNKSLISLKIVLFLFFGALSCIHVLNTVVPFIVGLNNEAYGILSMTIPIASILGPLCLGPLADKLAARNVNNFGKVLRIITAICMIFASLFYALQFLVPHVEPKFNVTIVRRPSVSFQCDSDGGIIYQERVIELKTCYHWDTEKVGMLTLMNCSYTCLKDNQFDGFIEKRPKPWMKSPPVQQQNDPGSDADYSYDDGPNTRLKRTALPNGLENDDSNYHDDVDSEDIIITNDHGRSKRNVDDMANPPHLCIKKNNKIEKCHVYTQNKVSMKIQATLASAVNEENDTHSAEWCLYPLEGSLCNIPSARVRVMREHYNSSTCKPKVECEIIDPYDSPDSVLADTQYIKISAGGGDMTETMTIYVLLRILGDICLLGALTLLNTAIIVSTRETSAGRGEVSKQLVWGAIAWYICFPLMHSTIQSMEDLTTIMTPVLAVAAVLLILAAIILLISTNMPLSPPEWWWHTKTGAVVYPMSAIRKYWPEVIGLTMIALFLGFFWSAIHTYLPWTYFNHFWIRKIGIISLLLLFFHVDYFIEYCGHSNILIGAFAVYILRFVALEIADESTWVTITLETFEPLTFGMTWITAILYMRHIIPRKLTATGQAILVLAHFCFGKCFGAVIGFYRDKAMYYDLTITACVIAVLYFILYHLILAPRCAAQTVPPPPDYTGPQQTNGHGSPNGTNGSYTPLRVYHNDRGKKGQFRY